MRTLMMGVGSRTFITDWARAASEFSDVVGIRTDTVPWIEDLTEVAPGVFSDQAAEFPVVVSPASKLRPGRWMSTPNAYLQSKAIERAARWAQSEHGHADIIHSHFAAASSGVPLAASKLGLAHVHTEHSSNLLWERADIHPSWRRTLAKVLESAAITFLVSDDLLQAVESEKLDGRFTVLPNPVDDSQFDPALSPSPTPTVVTVSSLIPRKRVDLIVRAFASARKTLPQLKLIVVGEGRLQPELLELADHLEVGDGVEFAGKVPRAEVSRIMSRSRLYMHASEAETFGVSLVEAQYAGLPVVTSDCGGVSRATGLSGMTVVANATVDTLSEHMVDAAARELSSERRARIAEDARSLYSVPSVGARLGKIYSDVIDDG